jgi:hypothetical protein
MRNSRYTFEGGMRVEGEKITKGILFKNPLPLGIFTFPS